MASPGDMRFIVRDGIGVNDDGSGPPACYWVSRQRLLSVEPYEPGFPVLDEDWEDEGDLIGPFATAEGAESFCVVDPLPLAAMAQHLESEEAARWFFALNEEARQLANQPLTQATAQACQNTISGLRDVPDHEAADDLLRELTRKVLALAAQPTWSEAERELLRTASAIALEET